MGLKLGLIFYPFGFSDWTIESGAVWSSSFNTIVHEHPHSQHGKPCLSTFLSAFLRCVSTPGSEEALHMPIPCSDAGWQSLPVQVRKSCWQRLGTEFSLCLDKIVTSLHLRESCFPPPLIIFASSSQSGKVRWVVIVFSSFSFFWQMFWFVKTVVECSMLRVHNPFLFCFWLLSLLHMTAVAYDMWFIDRLLILLNPSLLTMAFI